MTGSDTQGELREFVNRFLRNNNWDAAELGRRAGIAYVTVYAFMVKGKRVGHSVLNRLAPVMNVTPEELHRLAGLLPDDEGEPVGPDDAAAREISAILGTVDDARKREVIQIFRDIARTTAAASVAQSSTEASRPKPTRARSADSGA